MNECIIGISFDVIKEQNASSIIKKLLLLPEFEDYTWKLDCYTNNNEYIDASFRNPFSTSELFDFLSSCEYNFFFRLLGQQENKAIAHDGIESYEDYAESSFDTCILCCDVCCFEVYSKMPKILRAIEALLREEPENSTEICQILYENLSRSSFIV